MLFRTRPEWQVVAEASDGREAIQKAEELNPDLILLDVGLPNLNGIEAARVIRQRSPNSRIIFLSQNNDLDVVQAALSTGAWGYVRKIDAGRELLPAMDAVLGGKRFVGSCFKGYEFADTAGEKVPHRHEVQFYSDEQFLLDAYARFITLGLKSGRVAIVVVTESHQDGLVSRLKTQGLDVDAATRQGTYMQLDVNKTLSTFMVNDMPDSVRFFELVGGLMESAAKVARQDHHGVVACGECSPVLWAEGKADAAIRVEQLWDQAGKAHGVDILCGYALSSFHDEEDANVFRSICAEHSAVFSQ